MKNLNYYESLPDAINQELIEKELSYILKENIDSNKAVTLECLYELAIRHADNDELISSSLYDSLIVYVLEQWDKFSKENTETCLGIIINFRLQEAYEELLSNISTIKSINVRNVIEETMNDIGGELS